MRGRGDIVEGYLGFRPTTLTPPKTLKGPRVCVLRATIIWGSRSVFHKQKKKEKEFNLNRYRGLEAQTRTRTPTNFSPSLT